MDGWFLVGGHMWRSVAVASDKGCKLYDVEGQECLDFGAW